MQQLSDLQEEIGYWQKLRQQIADALELAAMEDEELAADLAAEAHALEEELGRAEFRILLSGPHDRSDAILAIHAGAGGTDAGNGANLRYAGQQAHIEGGTTGGMSRWIRFEDPDGGVQLESEFPSLMIIDPDNGIHVYEGESVFIEDDDDRYIVMLPWELFTKSGAYTLVFLIMILPLLIGLQRFGTSKERKPVVPEEDLTEKAKQREITK